jgi:hypothetical protein
MMNQLRKLETKILYENAWQIPRFMV